MSTYMKLLKQTVNLRMSRDSSRNDNNKKVEVSHPFHRDKTGYRRGTDRICQSQREFLQNGSTVIRGLHTEG